MYNPNILEEVGISQEEYNLISQKYRDYIKKYQHHNLVLCHRDLDLRNILVNEEGSLLIDFEYSGLLNRNWDLGCYLSELRLSYGRSPMIAAKFWQGLEDYSSAVNKDVSREVVNLWSGIVDYIWSCWSLAQISRGENYKDYFKERWSRACVICGNCLLTT